MNRKIFDNRGLLRFILIVIAVLAVHGIVLWLISRSSGDPASSPGTGVGEISTRRGEKERAMWTRINEQGEEFLNQGKNREAIELFERVLQLNPGNVRALTGKSQALMNLHRWEEAMPVLEQLLKIQPDHVDALLNRSRVYLERGDLDNYVKSRRQAHKAAPDMVRTNLELGRALAWVKKDTESLEYLNRAMNLNPTIPEKAAILTSTAFTHKLRREPEKAEALLKESLSLGVTQGDNHIQCYFMLVGIYLDQNRDDEAMKMMDIYRRMDPDFQLARFMGREIIATHYRNMGSLSLHRNRLEEAEQYYSRSLEEEPDNREGLMERAFVRLLQNRREDAKIDVNNWLATRPPAPRISQEMEQFAIAHTVLGNREKALTFINRALEMEPENYRLVGTRALISFTFDDREQFEKDLNFYLSHCSEDERENVEILLKRLGNV